MKNNMLRYKNDCFYIVNKTIYSSNQNNTSFYRAIDNRTKRTVGIKEIICADKRTAEEFRREITMLVKLEKYSKNIPVLYDYYIEGNTIYIIMQFVEGESLFDVMEKEKDTLLTEKTTIKNLRRLKKIAHILGEVHRCDGAQHKDLKPKNIVISPYNNDITLIDFGLTAMANLRGTGTPSYQAPEQSKNYSGVYRTDRIDVFAFGLLMFELLTGKRMEFISDLVLDASGKRWKEIKDIDNPFVPAELNNVLKKCLAYNPEERYENGGKVECAMSKIIRNY